MPRFRQEFSGKSSKPLKIFEREFFYVIVGEFRELFQKDPETEIIFYKRSFMNNLLGFRLCKFFLFKKRFENFPAAQRNRNGIINSSNAAFIQVMIKVIGFQTIQNSLFRNLAIFEKQIIQQLLAFCCYRSSVDVNCIQQVQDLKALVQQRMFRQNVFTG